MAAAGCCALESTSGQSKFNRISRLLIAGGTCVARGVLDKMFPPASLALQLADPVTSTKLGKAKLTQPQWKILYPSPGKYGTSEEFDISLLFKMFRNVCSLTPPATGWDSLPCNSDHSVQADLVRLKMYRNSVYGHVTDKNMEMTDCEFNQLWKCVSECIIRLASYISPEEEENSKRKIKAFLCEPLSPEHVRDIEQLNAWHHQDIETVKELTKIRKAFEMMSLSVSKHDTVPATDECPQPLHKRKLLDQFCQECNEFVCETCVTFFHRKHTRIDTKNSIQMQNVRNTVMEYAEQGKNNISKWKGEAAILENMKAVIEQELTTLVAGDDHASRFARNEVQEIFNCQIQRICKDVSHLENAVQYCQELATSTAPELLKNKNIAMQIIEELLRERRERQPRTVVPFLIQYKSSHCGGEIIEVQISGDSIFEAAVDETNIVNIKTNRLCCSTRRTFCEALNIEGLLKSPQKGLGEDRRLANVENNKDGTYTMTYTPIIHGKHELLVIIGDKPVCCPFQVIVRPKQYTILYTISNRGEGMRPFHRPHGVAVMSTSDVVVCECGNNTATVLSIEGKFIRTFELDNGSGERFFPKGIACCSDGRFVVSGESQLRMFDNGGNFIMEFGRHGTKIGELNCPCDVTVDNNDNIIVADTGNSRIQVFSSTDGRLLDVFGHGILNHPWSCVRYNNRFFVSDTRNHCIKVFNEKGVFLYGFGGEGESYGEFQHPQGIAIDLLGNVIVCDTVNDRIQTFTPDGHFLAEFISPGNEANEERGPCNLCFSHDGLVIVTYQWNHQVQVFK